MSQGIYKNYPVYLHDGAKTVILDLCWVIQPDDTMYASYAKFLEILEEAGSVKVWKW